MKRILLSLFLLSSMGIFAQENYTYGTFLESRIVNGHSVETSDIGEMKFMIQHRFGKVSGGGYELWGLDESTIRIGLDYGITDRLTVGLGRSSWQKTYDGFVKYKILRQQTGERNMPLTMTGYASTSYNTLKQDDEELDYPNAARLAYGFQLHLARKFSDFYSLQLSPTMVHRNIVDTPEEAHDVFSLGTAMRFQISSTIAILPEFYYLFPGQIDEQYTHSISLGVDIKTKGHTFQIHVSNSRGMIDKFYVAETTGKWADGDVHLGFNLSRDFRVRGRK